MGFPGIEVDNFNATPDQSSPVACVTTPPDSNWTFHNDIKCEGSFTVGAGNEFEQLVITHNDDVPNRQDRVTEPVRVNVV